MLEVIVYAIAALALLMVPGLLFSTVLYPDTDRLDFWKRMGFSLGLGTMLAALLGFVIALPGVGALSLLPFVEATAVACVALLILTYLRGGFRVFREYRRGVSRILRKPKQPEQQPAASTLEEKPPASPTEETKPSA